MVGKPIAYQAYQDLADRYAALIPSKDYNAYYDRPATLSLLDNVKGQHVLDAGCGPGVYAEILLAMGAHVTGIDVSENMLTHARHLLGDQVRLFHTDLESPLTDLKDNEFDGILSALVISYVRDLDTLFKEFYRVLKPNGWFVFSTEHPFFAFQYYNLDHYFDVQVVQSEWTSFDQKVNMPCYYHCLSYITDCLTKNGFSIERILEPTPTLDFKRVNPIGYEKRLKFPSFIHFKAYKKP